MNPIPQLIKQARTESGLTQLSLAEKISVKKSYISNIENDNQAISQDKAAEILQAMGYELTVEYSIKPVDNFGQLSDF